MKQFECHGPCDQGRRPCPTPEACVMPDEDAPKHEVFKVVMKDIAISVALITVIFFIVWSLV